MTHKPFAVSSSQNWRIWSFAEPVGRTVVALLWPLRSRSNHGCWISSSASFVIVRTWLTRFFLGSTCLAWMVLAPRLLLIIFTRLAFWLLILLPFCSSSQRADWSTLRVLHLPRLLLTRWVLRCIDSPWKVFMTPALSMPRRVCGVLRLDPNFLQSNDRGKVFFCLELFLAFW